jgi:hypothetical protein
MCGFIAILQSASIIDIVAIRRALNADAHRGPDASGKWREGDVFLGHRRLSIIDLATGAQPMQSSDGHCVIVFNGKFTILLSCVMCSRLTFRTCCSTEPSSGKWSATCRLAHFCQGIDSSLLVALRRVTAPEPSGRFPSSSPRARWMSRRSPNSLPANLKRSIPRRRIKFALPGPATETSRVFRKDMRQLLVRAYQEAAHCCNKGKDLWWRAQDVAHADRSSPLAEGSVG